MFPDTTTPSVPVMNVPVSSSNPGAAPVSGGNQANLEFTKRLIGNLYGAYLNKINHRNSILNYNDVKKFGVNIGYIPSIQELLLFAGVNEQDLGENIMTQLLDIYKIMLTRTKEFGVVFGKGEDVNESDAEISRGFEKILDLIKISPKCEFKTYIRFLFSFAHIIICFSCSSVLFEPYKGRRNPNDFGYEWVTKELAHMRKLLYPIFAMCFEIMFSSTRHKNTFKFPVLSSNNDGYNEEKEEEIEFIIGWKIMEI